MKFKDIIRKHLLTEGRTREISQSNAAQLLESQCRSFSPNFQMYRGTDFNRNFGFIEPKKFHRSSLTKIDYPDYFNLIVNNNRLWKDFPDRSKSVIGSTSKKSASKYGSNVYRVIPFDSASIAMTPKRDIWYLPYLEKRLGVSGDYFRYYIQLMSKRLFGSQVTDKEYSEFKSKLLVKYDEFEDVDKKLNDFPFFMQSMTNAWKSSNKTFFELIVDSLDPRKNKVSLLSTSDSTSSSSKELWTSSKCLLIKQSAFENFINEV